MNLIVVAAGLWLPEALKRRGLAALWRVTAEAFSVPFPAAPRGSWDVYRADYARFTAGEAAKVLGRDHEMAIRKRLFEGAVHLGDELRKLTRIRSIKDALALARVLYHAIGIEFHAVNERTITISRCYFSSYYSHETCGLISALDQGFLAGLSGGGFLEFRERITEGAPCCRAELTNRGDPT
jgi:hypothetical protein